MRHMRNVSYCVSPAKTRAERDVRWPRGGKDWGYLLWEGTCGLGCHHHGSKIIFNQWPARGLMSYCDYQYCKEAFGPGLIGGKLARKSAEHL